MSPEPRSVEIAIEIQATAEEVWAALTEADQLVNWFPLQAAVRPGVGGETRWSWDGGWTWVSEITKWAPGRALGLVNREQRPYDIEGRAMEPDRVAAATLVMDFTLETRSGKTHLRLVHSGFGHGAPWDDELEGVSVGWQFELRSLKWYLERHRGRRRRAGMARIDTSLSQTEAWARLRGAGGFSINPWPPKEGAPVVVRASGGDGYAGEVLFHLPDREFVCVVDQLGAGLFRIGTHQAGGRTGVTVWHASFSADQGFIDEATRRSQQLIDQLFGLD